jgi:hypothetical protein
MTQPVVRYGPGGDVVRYAYTPSVPSAFNTFIPVMNGEATAGLVVNFSRNPNTFGLPKWCSYTPVGKWTGLWLRMNIDQCARILDAKGNNNVWARGQDAPELTWNLEGFAWQQFYCTRYLYGYQLPRESEQQADFSVVSQQNAVEAMRAMTQRTQIGVDKALDTTLYDATHVATATVWGGGYINAGTATTPTYKTILDTMYRRIHLDSRGTVRPEDMVVVINPQHAHILAQSQEIHAYLKESPFAWPNLNKDLPGQKPNWGIPEYLYGYKHVIEDSVKNPNAKGATSQSGEYIWPWDKIAMFARPGGLIAPEGAMSFSTIHCFLLEDMAVEQFDDPINRRSTSRFVDDFGFEVVAPVSGCIATEVQSSQPAFMMAPGGPFPGGGGDFQTNPQAGFGSDRSAGTVVSATSLAELESRISQLSTVLDSLRTENMRLTQENARLSADRPVSESSTPASSGHEGGQERKRRDK